MMSRFTTWCCSGLTAVVALIAISVHLTGAEPPAGRVVLVAPFENQSSAKAMITYEVATNPDPKQPKRSFAIDRYSEAPRGYLENTLAKIAGISVVERQRVDAMLLESDFGSFSGLSDGAAATALGEGLGANVLVMGTILRVDSSTRTFSGYGVQAKRVTVTASVRVRAVDISTGTILASEIVDGTKVYPADGFSGLTDSDVAMAVIVEAMKVLDTRPNFVAGLLGRPAVAMAKVNVAPTPAGADILVDGLFRGNGPLVLDLPAEAPVTIRIEKTGFTPWERRLVPSQAPSITAELTPAKDAP